MRYKKVKQSQKEGAELKRDRNEKGKEKFRRAKLEGKENKRINRQTKNKDKIR